MFDFLNFDLFLNALRRGVFNSMPDSEVWLGEDGGVIVGDITPVADQLDTEYTQECTIRDYYE